MASSGDAATTTTTDSREGVNAPVPDAEVEDAFAKIRARAAIAALKRGSAHLYEHLPNTEIVWDMYHDSKSPYVCRARECHGQGFKLKSGLRMHLASKQHRDREAIATRRKAAEAKEDRTMKRLGLLPEVRKRAFVPDSDDDMEECGGLVILLAGGPGVGKTMTAESVAEKINAPLVKMELSQLTRAVVNQTAHAVPGQPIPVRDDRNIDDELSTTFSQAARWNAVLLIDECDMYLEERKDNTPERNHVVSQFLRELEYYLSLLFLTTNREKVLDPAVNSRIHLTIRYPELDKESRVKIWKTFLSREENSTVTEEECDSLGDININGRKIKNITKTARIMAKRAGHGISYSDIKNVMRITEGLDI